MSNSSQEQLRKNSSTIGPPAGIPAGGPIVDEFSSTVPGLNLTCV